MKKVFACALALCLALLMAVPAFADVLPPSYYRVTTEKPIQRYTLEKNENGSETLVEAGKTYAGETLSVVEVITINGKKYGVYQDRVRIPDSDVEVYRTLGKWVQYCFLMEDVFSPEEMATAVDKPHPWERQVSEIESIRAERSEPATEELLYIQQTDETVDETTAASSEQEDRTTIQQTDETVDEITAASSEPEDRTTIQQTDETVSEITAVTSESEGRAAMPILPMCIASAVILTLTAVVVLLLIRRKRNNIQNEIKEEGE